MNNNNLTLFAQKTLVAVSVSMAAVGLLYFGWLARTPLLWIAIAAFLAVAINPVVHNIQRFMPKKNLALATLTVLAIFCLIIGIMAWLFLAPIIQQTVNLITNLPNILARLNEELSKTPFSQTITLNKDAIVQHLSGDTSQIAGSLSQLGGVVINILTDVIDALVAFVAIVSLMFFMTVEGASLKSFSLRLVPKNSQNKITQLGKDVYGIINGYVVGNFMISGIFGVASAVVLWLCGSPYFLILGLLVGLIDLIPLVGATIGAVLVGIIFLLSGQPLAAIAFAIYTIIYVQFESSVLNPAIYSKNVDVSPLTVLVSILIGGAVAGIMGALVAIPIAATLRVVIKALLSQQGKEAA